MIAVIENVKTYYNTMIISESFNKKLIAARKIYDIKKEKMKKKKVKM
jgi:hypothetical protein